MKKNNIRMEKSTPVGSSAVRQDAIDKATGKAMFPGDLNLENQVYMVTLFSNRPHARIISIEISKALEVPGVLAVLTAKDVPHNWYGIEIADQPVLCGKTVRNVGDRVALVVAESERQAVKGLKLVEVEYEDLSIVDNPESALAASAPILHPGKTDNLLVDFKIEQGDIETGFRFSDVVIEETYLTSSQEHAYLQPDAGLAWIDEAGRVVVKSAGQDAYDDRRQIAGSLGLPEEQVRILYAEIGGAFGGREDLNIQICLALAAYQLRRPVKSIWSREETAIGHPKRHPMRIRHKWGATRDGKLIAQQIEITADAGAYASTTCSVLNTAAMVCSGPYEAPNIEIVVRGVYTNNPTSGAFRGFGAPQSVFAAEAHMTHLASLLSIDPVEIRMRNLIQGGSHLASLGEVPAKVSARETLEAAALAAGWENSNGSWSRSTPNTESGEKKGYGCGIAVGWKPIGYSLGWQEEATVRLELHGKEEIERAYLSTTSADVGQGSHTVLRQMVSQALNIPIERVAISPVDTTGAPSAGPTAASRITLMAGNAAIGAAEAALKAWINEERPAVAVYTYNAPQTYGFEALSQYKSGSIVMGYAAQAVEIEADLETGRLVIHRLVSAHDVGKAVNPLGVIGQVEGGAVQGLGWTAFENFIVKGGQVLTTKMSTYLIPTAMDIPASIETIILENPSPIGPYGAIGVGELPLLAVAPAIFAALQDAAGIWKNDLPMTPEKVWRSIYGG